MPVFGGLPGLPSFARACPRSSISCPVELSSEGVLASSDFGATGEAVSRASGMA
jgi:hypothetical protein